MLIGLLTSVPVVVAGMFSMTDMTAVMNAGFPAADLMYQATGNRPVTIFLSAWLIVVYACESRRSPYKRFPTIDPI